MGLAEVHTRGGAGSIQLRSTGQALGVCTRALQTDCTPLHDILVIHRYGNTNAVTPAPVLHSVGFFGAFRDVLSPGFNSQEMFPILLAAATL